MCKLASLKTLMVVSASAPAASYIDSNKDNMSQLPYSVQRVRMRVRISVRVRVRVKVRVRVTQGVVFLLVLWSAPEEAAAPAAPSRACRRSSPGRRAGLSA